jgi:hypothetical protein
LEYGNNVLSAVDKGVVILNQIIDIAASAEIDSSAEKMIDVLLNIARR